MPDKNCTLDIFQSRLLMAAMDTSCPQSLRFSSLALARFVGHSFLVELQSDDTKELSVFGITSQIVDTSGRNGQLSHREKAWKKSSAYASIICSLVSIISCITEAVHDAGGTAFRCQVTMDAAKKMMEKWGWAKGQGLGKDNRGMTSCLILRKDTGSSTQGRIESAAPEAAPEPSMNLEEAAGASPFPAQLLV
eukprot:s2439_g12.t1